MSFLFQWQLLVHQIHSSSVLLLFQEQTQISYHELAAVLNLQEEKKEKEMSSSCFPLLPSSKPKSITSHSCLANSKFS